MAELRILNRARRGKPAAIGFATTDDDAAAIHDATGHRVPVIVADVSDWMEAAHQVKSSWYGVTRLFFPSNDPADIEAAKDLAANTGAHVLPPPDKARSWAEHRDSYTTKGTAYVLGQSCPMEVANALPDFTEPAPADAGDPSPPPVEAYSEASPVGGGYGASEPWPEPGHIGGQLPEPMAYRDDLLPAPLAAYVADAAELASTPPDFIAAGLLVALGAVVGTRCTMLPKQHTGWRVPLNLWGMSIGGPSSRKTPAQQAVDDAGLDMLTARAARAHKEAVEQHAADLGWHKLESEGLAKKASTAAKKGDVEGAGRAAYQAKIEHDKAAPPAPAEPRFVVSDSTPEALGAVLMENPRGVLSRQDELMSLLGRWDKPGNESERAFYLTAFNGLSGLHVARIGRGLNLYVPRVCVSIVGGIQPSRLRPYLADAMDPDAGGNDGMLARFQLVAFPNTAGRRYRHIDRRPDLAALGTVRHVFERLDAADFLTWGAEPAEHDPEGLKPPAFGFDAEAQVLFKEWDEDLNARAADEEARGNIVVAGHLLKMPALFAKLALLCHLIEHAAGPDTGRPAGPVTLASANRAVLLCDYFESHARRMYALHGEAGTHAARLLARHLKRRALADGFTAREVGRQDWTGLRKRPDIDKALEALEDLGWVRSETVRPASGVGRHTTRYTVNPAVLGRAGSIGADPAGDDEPDVSSVSSVGV